jgi:acylphosphatase
MMKRVHIWINGTVQGVFFRRSSVDKAVELGVQGWARNLYDGRVEIVSEGAEEQLEKLIDWCKKGPPGAYVEGVEVRWEVYSGEFKKFRIMY